MSKASKKGPSKASPLSFKNPVFKMVIVLFCITAVCAFVLAFVNENTKEAIARYDKESLDNSLKAIYPDADSFDQQDYSDDIVSAVYSARLNDKLIGYCVIAKPIGYGGEITLMVGADLQDAVTKVLVVDIGNETPGLGTKAQEESFLSQFIGKSPGITLSSSDDNSIDAITGATISSRAVTSGVNAALDAVAEVQKGDKQ